MRERSGLLSCAASLLLIGVSCSSSGGSSDLPRRAANPPVKLALTEVGRLPAVAEHMGGDFPVKFSLEVENRSAEPVTLKRVQLVTMGYGAFTFNAASGTAFDTKVAPGQREIVEIWTPAHLNDTVSGGNGPVTIRVTATFQWTGGTFQHIEVQQVSAL
jgi:hypothetical protein